FKKTTLLFLLAISLNGCIFNKSGDDLVIVFNEITGSTKDSVTYNVKENSYHLTKNSNVEITLKNMSSKDLVTSNYYWIEKYDEGHWKDISFYEEFEDVEIRVEPNDEVEFILSLELYTDENKKNHVNLETGQYRIRKQYSWDWNKNNEATNALIIEFEVLEEKNQLNIINRN